EIAASVGFLPLHEVAKVRIGLVTGRDSYFLLSSRDRAAWNIPACCTTPIVDSGRRFAGIYVSKRHVRSWSDTDARCHLFLPCLAHAWNEPHWLRRFLAHGKTLGVHKGFKCSHRPIWYDVPMEKPPSAFLTYMSHTAPRVVANDARVSATNRLHYIRLNGAACDTRQFAFAFFNQLTLATAEISGRVYGGGVLKLEPSDCAGVMVPNPTDTWVTTISTSDVESVQEKLEVRDRDAALEIVTGAVCEATA